MFSTLRQAASSASTIEWLPTGLTDRFGAAMVYDSVRGQLVLFGGDQLQGPPLGDTWTGDGSTWTQKSPAVSPPLQLRDTFRDAAMAFDASTGTAVLFSVGGDTWTWDGTNWTQRHPATSPPARFGASLVYDASLGADYLFGGWSDSTNSELDDTWMWDGTNWTQQHPATNPPARQAASMAYDSSTHTVVLFGGNCSTDICNANNGYGNDTWTWDGTNWTQQSPATSPQPRDEAAMAYDSASGQVVLFGGSAVTGSLGDTWTWDGTNWTLRSPTNSPSARFGAAMAFDAATGKTVLFGGANPFGSLGAVTGDTWTWDGTDWTEQSLGQPSARQWASMVYDPANSTTVLVGGFTGYAQIGGTWTWNGNSWTLATTSGPVARDGAAMAYDAATQTVVLFGGANRGNLLSDTWTWDGSTWTQQHPTTSPKPAEGASMAYDGATGTVVLLDNGETWTWDGSAWTKQSPATSLPARRDASMVYDAARQQVVLFGGSCGKCSPFGDTWTWDGSTWTQQQPATSPEARDQASMEYDPVANVTVLVGGRCGYPSLQACGPVWTWDGTTWTQDTSASAPPGRYSATMALDANGSLLLFGGYDYDPGIDGSMFRYGQWTPGAAPSNWLPPTISGVPAPGKHLSTSNGAWTNSPTHYLYKWQRCDNTGANCVNIVNATLSKYLLTKRDAGHEVRSEVQASNTVGPAAAGYTPSLPTAVVVGKPHLVSAPVLSGVAKVGQRLSVTTGNWTYAPTGYAYHWLRCSATGFSCVSIASATKSSYKVTARDAGHTLKAKVTATNAAGYASATTGASGVVAK